MVRKSAKTLKVFRNIDEFLLNSDFPANPKFDLFKIFKQVFNYLRDVQARQDPDLVLWQELRDIFLDLFNTYGYSESAFLIALEKRTGYESGQKLNATQPSQREQQKSINDQKCELKPIPAEDLDALLNQQNLTQAEIALKEKKRKAYNEDFNLNNSSDVSILNEILSCEMALERFTEYEMRHPTTFIGEERDAIFKRLQGAQNTLGVSRIKRTESNDELTDTIASAVETYEHIAQFVDLHKLHFLQEIQMILQRYDRAEVEAWLAVSYIGELPHACISNLGMTLEEACEAFVNNQMKPFLEQHLHEIDVLEEKCKSVTF